MSWEFIDTDVAIWTVKILGFNCGWMLITVHLVVGHGMDCKERGDWVDGDVWVVFFFFFG